MYIMASAISAVMTPGAGQVAGRRHVRGDRVVGVASLEALARSPDPRPALAEISTVLPNN
jgi:hypothetical protein